jgi:hypothetical protein
MAVTSSDDYLWDRSGEPDADVEALEKALRPLGHVAAPPPAARRPRRVLLYAAAAVVLVAIGAGVTAWLLRPERKTGGISIRDLSSGRSLGEDTWIVAGDSGVELALGDVGRVTLDGGSRLQVRRAEKDLARLYLEHGSLEARVAADARPRFFQVETPATRCVDLGCRYVLSVDAAGTSRVEVLTGRVAFEDAGREVYVPAGAGCIARAGAGAGTPRFLDAPPRLVAALDAFDALPRAASEERREKARAIFAAVPDARQALVLWHLLQDPDADVAEEAMASLERITAPPSGCRCVAGTRPTPDDVRLWKDTLAAYW